MSDIETFDDFRKIIVGLGRKPSDAERLPLTISGGSTPTCVIQAISITTVDVTVFVRCSDGRSGWKTLDDLKALIEKIRHE